MKNLPLNMLRAFAAVYETGGVRPAARLLGVTHSSVSRFVRELEALTGLPLIDRSDGKRLIAFTPEGEQLARVALKSFAQLEKTFLNIQERRKANSVVVETTPSLASRWLLPRLGALEQKLPRIELSIVVDQRLRRPADSQADFSIRLGRGPWPGAHCIPFLDDRLYPVMSPDYWRSSGKPSRPEHLPRCRLLHDRDPQTSWRVWKDALGPPKLEAQKGPRYSSFDLVLRAAEQGLGVALARHHFAKDAIESGLLVAPLGDCGIDLPKSIWLVLPEQPAPKLATRQLIACLQEEAAK
jgi:LysR family glycine cleavage system transcriptional activator